MKEIQIIIVTYNGMNWLPKTLALIPNEYSVIIIDNNSTDATVKFILENYPTLTLLPQHVNLGFGAANNIGISYALKNGADYVFLLNQDAYLEKDTIEKLIEVYKNNAEYGVISPIHLNGEGSNLDLNFSNYLRQNKKLFFDALKNKYTEIIYEVPFVNAAAWLLPIKTLEIVGGFDPLFYHYAEDDNYCQRVLFHGLKIGVVPNTYVYHDREFRETTPINSIKDKLFLKERYLKSKWANVNIETENDIKKFKLDTLKLIIKLFFKLKFKQLDYYLNELLLIKKITNEIKKSRKINTAKGKHYIS